ncbi:polyphenol oxidase family protein [Treponema sp. C6A8]|uniref:polyphenol oxidase family protein n=1 Tax=Treponema sp. C6A8 TaxID=1410609 RepID=UPI00056FB58B|nr:polyphenol oxidase family protein [Treponema sp. C6A8]
MTRFPLEITEKNYVTFPFFKNDKLLSDSPLCGMSIKAAGSMRFRWNETNENRDKFLKALCEQNGLKALPVELIHSKIVYDIKEGNEADGRQGDGMITCLKEYLPVVTVADCMPVYLYESESGLFGVVHSGWKGTGIIGEAINLAEKNYGVRAENFSVVLGPHIRKCCYIVNQERADYFAENFSPDCVEKLEEGGSCSAGGRGLAVNWNSGSGKLYRLSLEKANLAVLKKAGVPDENIAVCSDCTCCNEKLGSNRRETAEFSARFPNASSDQLSKSFTVQAAFCGWIK